jgi:hypothetical protein
MLILGLETQQWVTHRAGRRFSSVVSGSDWRCGEVIYEVTESALAQPEVAPRYCNVQCRNCGKTLNIHTVTP